MLEHPYLCSHTHNVEIYILILQRLLHLNSTLEAGHILIVLVMSHVKVEDYSGKAPALIYKMSFNWM